MAQLATGPKNSGHLCPVHNDRDRPCYTPTLTIACYRHVANPTMCTGHNADWNSVHVYM